MFPRCSGLSGFLGLLRLVPLALLLAAPLGAADSRFGVNIHAPQGWLLAPELDAARDLRVGWVRIDFAWSDVEATKGTRDFSVYDALVAAAETRHLAVYASVGSTPAWATDGAAGIGVPRSTADFTNFVTAAASRYGNRVAVWGFWNEPNQAIFWAGTRQQYIDVILKPGADAVHAASPGSRVAGPELAHLVGNGAVWYQWLSDVIAQAGSRLDIVSHHVYGSTASAVTTKLEATTTFGTNPQLWNLVPPSVKEVLTASGWLGKPFWLTETGWASDQLGEPGQATQYTALLNDWFSGVASRAWMSHVFFYELKDSAVPPLYGLVRSDGSVKPAYTVYQAFITAHTKGDVNGDGNVDVADVFALVTFLFAGGSAPVGDADVNGDGKTDVVDVFYLTNYLFSGGPAPR
jgi:hypothetical protein